MKPQQRQARMIASALFVALFFLWGGCYATVPVFVAALLKSFTWSRTQVSLIPSMLAVSVGCSGPVAGWLLDRCEARFVMGFGAALAGGGLIAASRSGTFPELLAADILMGVGLGLSSWLPASVVIANWFGDRRGTAMGLATAGMESGGMAMTFAAGYIIGRFNWSTAYLALSLPILILVLPCLWRSCGLALKCTCRELRPSHRAWHLVTKSLTRSRPACFGCSSSPKLLGDYLWEFLCTLSRI
jgi:MFS family permease